MARAKRKTEPVPPPPVLPVPRGRRVAFPPLPVKHSATVRDARGDVRSFALFDRAEDANRFAREKAAVPGRHRVAQVEPFVVKRRVSQVRQPESAADRSVRLNRVALSDAALLELLAPRPRRKPAPSCDALLALLADASDDPAGLLLDALGVGGA